MYLPLNSPLTANGHTLGEQTKKMIYVRGTFFFPPPSSALFLHLLFNLNFILSAVIVSLPQNVHGHNIVHGSSIPWVHFLFKFARNFICKLNTIKNDSRFFFRIGSELTMHILFFFSYPFRGRTVSFPGKMDLHPKAKYTEYPIIKKGWQIFRVICGRTRDAQETNQTFKQMLK